MKARAQKNGIGPSYQIVKQVKSWHAMCVFHPTHCITDIKRKENKGPQLEVYLYLE